MSTSRAKVHASRAQKTDDTNDKLDEIAKSIYELARALSAVESKVNRIK